MSVPFTARQAAAWTGGEVVRGDAETRFTGACIDTRTVTSGQLFIAIVGPNHDAHGFLAQAATAGASGLLVERGRAPHGDLAPDLPIIAVNDTTRALGSLARGHRAAFDGPLIAITGSNGKTTTKEMCAAILSVAGPCLKNAGNLNNQFGLPLTLLRRESEHRTVVVELGMNHRGEIAALVDIARPSVGVITNVGTAHIEHLGSTDEIALEKGDLVAGLADDATAVLNADDPLVAAQATRTAARVMFYGTGSLAEVRAENATEVGNRGYAFDLVTPSGRERAQVAGLGATAWKNALAAASGALAAGVPLSEIVTGLARYRPVVGRLAPIALPTGAELIDDTYNANPQSMAVALQLLAERAPGGRRIAVIGDMGELGDTAHGAHRDAGRQVAGLGIDFLFTLGLRADDVADGAVSAGMPSERVCVCRDHEEVATRVNAIVRADDCVLVKGSRAMKMERIVELLTARVQAVKESA